MRMSSLLARAGLCSEAVWQSSNFKPSIMKIMLNKFGITLVSRQSGKEAWAALQPLLKNLATNESIEVDFAGVAVLTPSWADEFITALEKKFPHKVVLINATNASVQATLRILKESNN